MKTDIIGTIMSISIIAPWGPVSVFDQMSVSDASRKKHYFHGMARKNSCMNKLHTISNLECLILFFKLKSNESFSFAIDVWMKNKMKTKKLEEHNILLLNTW